MTDQKKPNSFTNIDQLKNDIESCFEAVFQGLKFDSISKQDIDNIKYSIDLLDQGEIRVCEKIEGKWITKEWVKKAILLYFKIKKMKVMDLGLLKFVDKIPVKSWTGSEGVRVVPHAIVRKGAFISAGAVLMPSYVNIGAFVGSGTMVDTWATVGSCAQIGANVHLSGGVGIGGVLEPLQASPVVIEDNAFIGSGCIIVEGALIEEGAVIGAGVTITGSTRIIDVTGPKEVIHRGFVPKNSIVIPGQSAKTFPSGTYMIPSALIIGTRDARTDLKTSLNSALRDVEV
jgi:2,3,4,5-tetrahydropyridine-2-carboxylate N-succinyltransferase